MSNIIVIKKAWACKKVINNMSVSGVRSNAAGQPSDSKYLKYKIRGSLQALRYLSNIWCAVFVIHMRYLLFICGIRNWYSIIRYSYSVLDKSLFISGIRYSYVVFEVFYRIPHETRDNKYRLA